MRTFRSQKDFILILILWNTCVTLGNVKDNIRFWLGCEAEIPCGYSGLDSIKWFYKKEEQSNQIKLVSKDKNGLVHHSGINTKRHSLKYANLIISDFTDDDQGMYCCERSRQDNCIREKSNIISVKKETLEETQRTVYVLPGTSFKQECSGNFSSFKWVFEANNPTTAGKTLRPESVTVTSNKTIHIPNVTIPDAGKYTCLVNPCGRSSLKLLTVNLCVIKVSVKPGDVFAVSCAVVCNKEFRQKSRVSSQMMNTSGVSVHVDGSGKLTCNASQIFTSDERSTVTSSHASTTTTFRKTTEGSTQNEDWSGLVCGLVVPPACLVLILMFCLRSRLKSAFPFLSTCCVFSRVTSVEDEPNVVYSSVAFRTPAKTRSNTTHNECIYSEVKCTRKCST